MVGELTRRSTVAAGLGVAAMALSPRAAQAQPSPVATTRHGPVRGYVDDGVIGFRGIRYGADTGPRRFQPPVAPAPWTEVADATAYGPASPQRGRVGEPVSEDCLFPCALRDLCETGDFVCEQTTPFECEDVIYFVGEKLSDARRLLGAGPEE